MSKEIYNDYWKLREALQSIESRLLYIDDPRALEMHKIAVDALRETDIANVTRRMLKLPVNLTDAEVDALIKSDQGDSYYVILPDGTSRFLGYTAEAYVERAELRAAARLVLEKAS